MARYREKTEEELVWNNIRRTVTTMIDLAVRERRERAVNTALTVAFQHYSEGLKRGEMRELETRYKEFAVEIVKDIVPDLEFIDGTNLDDL